MKTIGLISSVGPNCIMTKLTIHFILFQQVLIFHEFELIIWSSLLTPQYLDETISTDSETAIDQLKSHLLHSAFYVKV